MGDYVLSFVRPKQPARKTYMLTDHLVFSSAVMFADAFRDYNVGTIVGYETGGTPSHYGYPRTFELKNSGIDFGVSRTPFNAPKPRPGDDQHGVLPDVAVDRELLLAFTPWRTSARIARTRGKSPSGRLRPIALQPIRG
jgi:C-terminal processing protease CtpA/Prc